MNEIRLSVTAEKLYQYLEWIKSEDVGANFVIRAEERPLLIIDLEGVKAQLSYIPEEDESCGVLSMVSRIEMEGYDEEEALVLCDTFNAESMGGFTYTSSETEEIYYRQSIQDAGDVLGKDSLLYFITRYRVYLDILIELINMSKVEE